MEQCYQGHADGRYSKLLTRLNNSELLLLDDWGLEPLSSEQRSDLLEIVDLMYQRGSIIVVSQLPVENWYKIVIQFDGSGLLVKNYFFFLMFCGYVFKYLKKTLEKYDGEL